MIQKISDFNLNGKSLLVKPSKSRPGDFCLYLEDKLIAVSDHMQELTQFANKKGAIAVNYSF